MRHWNLFKSIVGGALLLVVLGLAYGLNPSRGETPAPAGSARTARPARLPIAADEDAPLSSLGSIQGTPVRADIREPGALHVVAQPELLRQPPVLLMTSQRVFD